MDMEKMFEEYRQAQRIRISRKLLANNKAMTLVQFRKVQVQDGDGSCFKDVTMEIRKGTHPDPGLVVFYNQAAKFNLIIVGCSFIFNDKLPCEKQLKIILLLLLLLFDMLVNGLYTQTKTNSKQRYTMQQLKKRLCTRYGKRSIKPLKCR
jgi:hypothetical protein